MGAGRILSEVGEGLYQVKLIFGDPLDDRLAALETKRTQLEQELLQLRANQLDLNEIWTEAYNDLLYKIAVWETGIELPAEPVMKPPQMSAKAYEYVMRTAPKIGLPDYLVASFTRFGTAAKNKAFGEKAIAEKQAEYLALLKKQTELTALKDVEEEGIPAWCADYTEGLKGNVDIATLEVFGEYEPPIGGGVNIKPGFSSAAWAASYGKLQRSIVLSESGFAWNMTMLNPWEKWMPKWRYATVTAVNATTLDLELNPVLSTIYTYLSKITTLNDPWTGVMNDVAVTYMVCNARAFEIGDEVVVEFTKKISGGIEYYESRVIGFKDHPRRCSQFFYVSGYLIARGIATPASALTGDYFSEGDWGILSYTNFRIYLDGKLLVTASFETSPFIIRGASIVKYNNKKFINVIRIQAIGTFGYRAIAAQCAIEDIINATVTFADLATFTVSLANNLTFPQLTTEWKFSEDGNHAAAIYYYNNDITGYNNYNIFECLFFEGSAIFFDHGPQQKPEQPAIGYAYDYNSVVDYRNNRMIVARQARTYSGSSEDITDTYKIIVDGTDFIETESTYLRTFTEFPAHETENKVDEGIDFIVMNLRSNVFFYHKYRKTIDLEVSGVKFVSTVNCTYNVTETAQHQFIVNNDGVEISLKDTGEISATESGSYTFTEEGFLYNLGDAGMHTYSRTAHSLSFQCLSARDEAMLYYYAGFSITDPGDINPSTFTDLYEAALQPNFYLRWYSEADITVPLPFMTGLIGTPIKLV